MYKRYVVGPSRNTCCRGTVINVTYSECVSIAIVIQYAKRMSCVMSYVARAAVQHFSTLSHKRRDFRRSYCTEHQLCVLTLCASFVLIHFFFVLRGIQRDIVINAHTYSCKVRVICVMFWANVNVFQTNFF